MKKCIKNLFNLLTTRPGNFIVSSTLYVFLTCSCGLFFGFSASALQLTDGTTQSVSSGYINLCRTDNSCFRQINGTVNDPDIVFTNIPVLTTVTHFHLSLSNYIPANAIFTFQVLYGVVAADSANFPGYEYYGLASGSGWTLLNETCTSPSTNYLYQGNNGTRLIYEATLSCQYTGYTNVRLTSIDSLVNSNIIMFKNTNTSSSGNIDSRIYMSPISSRTINWNGLTQDDRDWLEDVLENTSTDVSSVVSAVESQTTTLNNSINNLRSDTQAQTDAIEEGNEDAQSRWEADKAEEAEREEAASDDADAVKSVFRFEIRNPFMGLLGLFTNNCPANIPTIASMINLESSVYPCWFPQSIRSILTPVFGISSAVLLFGFIVRGFLRKGNFSGGIEI